MECRRKIGAATRQKPTCSNCGKPRSKDNRSGLCFRCATVSGVFGAGKQTKPEVEVEEKADDLTLKTLSAGIDTPEKAIAHAGVDLTIWEVVRKTIKAYQQGTREDIRQLFSIHIEFRRRVPAFISDAIPEIVKELSIARIPSLPKKGRRKPSKGILAEFSPYDHHFGKLAWGKETGEDYDLSIAVDLFRRATEDAVAKVAEWNIESWLFPVGSDLLHFDGSKNETVNGTPMDTDGRWGKVYSAAIGTLVWSVDLMRQVAPVKVVWVPGNHDLVSSWFCVQVLKARYESARDLTVDDGPSPRKYHEHCSSLIGMTHGGRDDPQHRDLPTIMATEKPAEWARTRHHEWHVGDQHRKRAMTWMGTDTHTGCVVRTLPSLAGTDSWHHQRGFVSGGNRCAELYLWGADGYVGHLSVGSA